MAFVVECMTVYKRLTFSYKTVYKMVTGVCCHGFTNLKTGDMESLYVFFGWLFGRSLRYNWLSCDCSPVFACLLSIDCFSLFRWNLLNSVVLITISVILSISIIVTTLPTYYITQNTTQPWGQCGYQLMYVGHVNLMIAAR